MEEVSAAPHENVVVVAVADAQHVSGNAGAGARAHEVAHGLFFTKPTIWVSEHDSVLIQKYRVVKSASLRRRPVASRTRR